MMETTEDLDGGQQTALTPRSKPIARTPLVSKIKQCENAFALSHIKQIPLMRYQPQ
jgi:hypothetical protein